MDKQAWPEFMTVAEVAEILRVSRMTVYRLVGSGELPGTHAGPRTIRITADALRDYLERRQ